MLWFWMWREGPARGCADTLLQGVRELRTDAWMESPLVPAHIFQVSAQISLLLRPPLTPSSLISPGPIPCFIYPAAYPHPTDQLF